MSADLETLLAPYGIDYDDALDRFGGNTGLFKRLALKYLADSHYAGLVAALETGDYEEAYAQAHSLKGVSGNLSLADLYRTSARVSDALREGEVELAKAHMPDVTEAHLRAVEGLGVLQAEG